MLEASGLKDANRGRSASRSPPGLKGCGSTLSCHLVAALCIASIAEAPCCYALAPSEPVAHSGRAVAALQRMAVSLKGAPDSSDMTHISGPVFHQKEGQCT